MFLILGKLHLLVYNTANKKLFFFVGPKIMSQNWKKLLETNFDSVGQ